MNRLSNPVLLTSVLFVTFLMTACTPKPEQSHNNHQATDASPKVLDQLKTRPIQEFPATPDDAHDITLLTEYDQKFNEMNNELEADLQKRAVEGKLSAEITQQLKQDSIRSSLNMLKDLDLKTQQGRYIQGLLYQYWENQAKVYAEKKQSPDGELKQPSDAVKGMGDLFTAQEQLNHWKEKNQKQS
ncbi:hypothetical protein [Acinetobacter sp. ANC 4648]|uniref:hypothetical protein n=1 Tax=Acinetobacter sp. ANC 4648 TaxID=1977875 RepID=UPI000A356DBA|nr:hypothetical protein [Acinetobacter sp. ANC 4648]OTG80659.1 hypothetical protein B9T27_12365 [Acinetobacter sp. ANC 4648]